MLDDNDTQAKSLLALEENPKLPTIINFWKFDLVWFPLSKDAKILAYLILHNTSKKSRFVYHNTSPYFTFKDYLLTFCNNATRIYKAFTELVSAGIINVFKYVRDGLGHILGTSCKWNDPVSAKSTSICKYDFQKDPEFLKLGPEKKLFYIVAHEEISKNHRPTSNLLKESFEILNPFLGMKNKRAYKRHLKAMGWENFIVKNVKLKKKGITVYDFTIEDADEVEFFQNTIDWKAEPKKELLTIIKPKVKKLTKRTIEPRKSDEEVENDFFGVLDGK